MLPHKKLLKCTIDVEIVVVYLPRKNLESKIYCVIVVVTILLEINLASVQSVEAKYRKINNCELTPKRIARNFSYRFYAVGVVLAKNLHLCMMDCVDNTGGQADSGTRSSR